MSNAKSLRTPAQPDPVEIDEASVPAASPAPIRVSKQTQMLALLREGATLAAMQAATGWQAHSVRGFISGTVRKKLGLAVSSEIGTDDGRIYRVVG
jgi:alkylhydroperoxidase family enzyme